MREPAAPALTNPGGRAMTKGEREDLQRLVRQREKVLKSAAAQRSAELLADFEQQVASIYSYDQDEVWAEAHRIAHEAGSAALQAIMERCRELGIPEEFAPGLEVAWRGRGQNATQSRREELRRVAKTRIAAIEKEACVKIELLSVDMQARIVAHGLSSDAAVAFLADLSQVESLMPPLEFGKIATMLDSRRIGRRYDDA